VLKIFIQNEFLWWQEAKNSYFSKESHLEYILKAKDELLRLENGTKSMPAKFIKSMLLHQSF